MAYNQLPERPDESVGSWMITLLITPIPLVGFIYILVLAFGSAAAPSKRNFARALLAWEIIGMVATILLYVVFGVAIFSGINSGH